MHRISSILIATGALATLAGCAATPEQRALDEQRAAANVPAATPVGKPVSCIQTSRIRDTDVRNDSVIDFEMNGGKVYRNRLPYACGQLGFEKRFLYQTQIGQLCSVDTITVLYASPPGRGATCQLGEFQEVKLAKR
ncbi:DUF6491 family protein [Stakelama pacifica]|uniref:Uncharacterized protein n=1 Tax=Stakelama pacifica TaxID=517720 RepID=A0A4V3BS79_9SPHN|nr:DUF6491 family protein [Stakelama pacifica]TDN78418.1 hypothetical protein EV664_11738 [Stakelama pacifica]GGO99562.1 hypothetical protein GCM10011329_33350 [Stakelama pacifica]